MKPTRRDSRQETERRFSKALALQQAGRVDEAQQHYRQVLQRDPQHVNALSLLGAIYLQRQAAREAIPLLKKSLALFEAQPAAWCNLGLALEKTGEREAALACYDRSLALAPADAGVWYNRGALLRQLRRHDDAIASNRQALALQPGMAAAWNNLGNVLTDRGHYQEAIDCYTRALEQQPHFAEAWNNRGVCHWLCRHPALALADYESAIRLKPDYVDALANRATVLHDSGDPAAAWQAATAVLAVQPQHGEAHALCLELEARQCDWQHRPARLAALRKALSDGQAVRPFSILAAFDDPALHQRAARRWATQQQTVLPGASARGDTATPARWRIAYLSADLQQHPVAVQLVRVIEQQDRQRFAYYALSDGPASDDPLRQRLAAAFEHFIDVAGWTDEALRHFLREQQIDILVDLGGYTAGARPALVLSHPAPLVVNYLGYPGTLGSPAVDYLIADPVLLPPAQRAFIDESIVWMPGSFMPHDPTRTIAAGATDRRAAGLPESAFVFCCFNQAYKITPERFASWMQILGAVPGSVLWLSVGQPAAQDNLRQAAVQHGIDSARLLFAARVEDASEHLARLACCADLFLDTAPYNAHATACDALWAGLPVLTCAGQAYPARVAASLLAALDLHALITGSETEYISTAVDLARNPDKLQALRTALDEKRAAASGLFDAERQARTLEQAWETIALRQARGLPPADIALAAP